MKSDRQHADIRLDNAIGYLLRIGVSIAAAIVLAGLISYLSRSNGHSPDLSHFRSQQIHLSGSGPWPQRVAAWNSSDVVYLGILLLIATPVARVLFCIVGFAVERDRFYVAVSSLVLAILLYALFFYR